MNVLWDLDELDDVIGDEPLVVDDVLVPFSEVFLRKEINFGDSALTIKQAGAGGSESGLESERYAGSVRMLTNCRYFGFIINPSPFFCALMKTSSCRRMFALEVTNTPWGESIAYVFLVWTKPSNARMRNLVKRMRAFSWYAFIPYGSFFMTGRSDCA